MITKMNQVETVHTGSLVNVPVNVQMVYWYCQCGGELRSVSQRWMQISPNGTGKFVYTHQCSNCKIQIDHSIEYPHPTYTHSQ